MLIDEEVVVVDDSLEAIWFIYGNTGSFGFCLKDEGITKISMKIVMKRIDDHNNKDIRKDINLVNLLSKSILRNWNVN